MAQNVGVPRFFVNMPEFFAETGEAYSDSLPAFFRTLPVNVQLFGELNEEHFYLSDVPFSTFTDNCFLAVLGHRVTDQPWWSAGTKYFQVIDEGASPLNFTNDIRINAGEGVSPYCTPEFNGFTIASFTRGDYSPIFYSPHTANQVEDGDPVGVRELGSIIIGTYYEMKNAPNLSLTMERQYGGTKEITTYNGSSMSNTMWSKPPNWGSAGAWELFHTAGDPPIVYHDLPPISRSARKKWKLSFSYMDDGDLWGSNQMIFSTPHTIPPGMIDTSLYEDDDIVSNTEFKYDLLSDDNFFSQVWHKTLGTIPFLFQPDKDNNAPDQLAICRFDDNSLKATQTAPGLYDISVTIEEVW